MKTVESEKWIARYAELRERHNLFIAIPMLLEEYASPSSPSEITQERINVENIPSKKSWSEIENDYRDSDQMAVFVFLKRVYPNGVIIK